MIRGRRIRRPRRTGGRRPQVADALGVAQASHDAKLRDTARGRRRRALAASLLLHAILFAFLLLARPSLDEMGTLTEIAYINEAALQPAPAMSTSMEPAEPVNGAPAPGLKEARFTRDALRAQQQPVPQDDYTLSDQLASRLAAMRSTTQKPVSGLPTPHLPVARSSAALAKMEVAGPRIALQRGTEEAKHVPLIALRRSARGEPVRVSAAVLPHEVAISAPAAASGDATARVRLAGADLMGPVANRPILSHAAPTYPDWAKRDAVEASVTLRFVVRPDGSIKENLLVERTSGYQDFDDRALTALSAWRFAPLHEGRTGEQWGVITLHFRLREAKS